MRILATVPSHVTGSGQKSLQLHTPFGPRRRRRMLVVVECPVEEGFPHLYTPRAQAAPNRYRRSRGRVPFADPRLRGFPVNIGREFVDRARIEDQFANDHRGPTQYRIVVTRRRDSSRYGVGGKLRGT